MRGRKPRKKLRIGRALIALSLILIGVLMLFDLQMRPIIEKTASYQSKILATRIINDAVYSELDNELFSYANLVTVVYGNDGKVNSIETNMVNMNKLKVKITKSVNDQLSAINDYDLSVSLGTLSGIQIFYNSGPLIPIIIKPEGYVEAELISSFESAGINQTLHRIIIKINVDISAIVPGYTASAEVETQFTAAETVIVGEIPESYTHVILSGNDKITDINNYKSE